MDTAVVLAAGRGSRMGALTADTPKPLLAVGGRPLIAHALAGLAAAGVRRVIVVTGYLGDRLEAALGRGDAFGLRLEYCRQARPDGTARALLCAAPQLGAQPFLVCWSDILVPAALYGELAATFAARPGAALLAVNAVADPWRGAAVYVRDDWRVTRLVEKPPRGGSQTPWNNAGVMVFAPRALDYARRLPPSVRGEYELPQAVAEMVRAGEVVHALPVRGPWADVGTPEDLAAAAAVWGAAPP